MAPTEPSFARMLRTRLSGQGAGAQVARGTIWAFLANGGGMAAGYASSVLVARTLGESGWGEYHLVISWLNVLVTVALVGMNLAAVRLVPEHRARDEGGLLKGFVRYARRLGLLTSFTLAALMTAAVYLLGGLLSPTLRVAFYAGAALLPVWAVLDLDASLLRGFKRVLWSLVPARLLRPLLFGLVILALHASQGEGMTSAGALLANLGVTVVCLLVAWAALRCEVAAVGDVPIERKTVLWRGVALPMLLMATFNQLLASTDSMMLGYLSGSATAGTYGTASRTVTVVPFMLVAANTIVGPMIAELHAKGLRQDLQRMLRISAWAVFAFTVPVAALLVGFGDVVLGLFGPEHVVARPALIALVGGEMFNCLCGSVGLLMTMTGDHNRAAVVLAGSAVLNVVLNAVLIPPFGILGAAVATASTLALWNVTLLILVTRRLRLNPTIFSLPRRRT